MSFNNRSTMQGQAQSHGWFGQKTALILLLLFIIVATGLLFVIAVTAEMVRSTVQSGDQGIVDHIVPGILFAADLINQNTQCKSHFSVVDSALLINDSKKPANLALTPDSTSAQQRLIDVVPVEYIDGKLTQVLMVYEECQLPKMSCTGWNCTLQPDQSTNKQNR